MFKRCNLNTFCVCPAYFALRLGTLGKEIVENEQIKKIHNLDDSEQLSEIDLMILLGVKYCSN